MLQIKTTLMILILQWIQPTSSYNFTWVERTFPNKIIQEQYTIRHDNDSGCTTIYCPVHDSYFVFNESCTKLPKYLQNNFTTLSLRTSRIKQIDAGDFNKNWSNLIVLNIEMNPELVDIQPGAFKELINLKKLSISNNFKLNAIEPELFSGLNNLNELNFIKNNMSDLSQFILSINKLTLPKLKILDLSQNPISKIKSKDFLILNDTSIEELYLILCDLIEIDSSSFQYLNNLKLLDLTSNNLNTNQLKEIVFNITKTSKNFTKLIVSDNLIDREASKLLKSISLTNITELIISENRFNLIQPGLFPIMKSLKILDISGLKAVYVDSNTFNSYLLPNLITLIANKNRFPGVFNSLLLPTLKELDLSENTCDKCITTSLFKISDYKFQYMINLKILNLSKNSLYRIKKFTFYGLKNLEILNLSNCSIFTLDDYLFQNLTNLKLLDLSYNKLIKNYSLTSYKFYGLVNLKILKLHYCEISTLSDKNLFNELINLEYLTLRGNFLNELNPYWFLPLNKLIEIDLAINDITEWNTWLFLNNTNLKVLSLYSNKIRHINVGMMEDFRRLQYLDLGENQLYCSCLSVLNVKKYLIKYNVTFSKLILNQSDNKCFRPKSLINTKFTEYIQTHIDDDLCLNSQTNNLIILIVLIVFILFCLISIILYYLRWYIRYWLFLFRQAMRHNYFPGRKQAAIDSKYKYDAFVSYSHEDRNFVVRLVTMLETQSPHYRLCVFERDFTVGDVITESVLECISASRRTILVLSDSFARSTWCQWEMHLAQYKRLFYKDERVEPLVIVKIGEIMDKHMTPTLRYLIKSRVYLLWNSDLKKQRVFWQKLREALAPINV